MPAVLRQYIPTKIAAATTSLQLDTATPSEYTIEYHAFDQSGLMGSASRTVIVSAPANDNAASSTPPVQPAANDNSPLEELPATGTE